MQKTILIVDDEADIRDSLAEFFEIFEHFKTIKASSGTEALSLLSENDVDMVISDIRMPQGDGIFLVNQLKSKIEKGLKFIFMTGYSDLTRSAALKLGAKEIFYKPFDLEVLSAYIRKLFEEKH